MNCGAIPPLPHMSSLCDASLIKHSFTFSSFCVYTGNADKADIFFIADDFIK
jgi:hypothetical protein